MKKIHGYLIFTISLFCINQTNAQSWTFVDELSNIKLTYTYELKTLEKDSSLNINLSATDILNNFVFDYGSVLLDSKNVLNSYSLGKTLKSKYSEISKIISKQNMVIHHNILNKMIISLKDTLSERNQYSFVFQGLFMYLSILNGANRESQNLEFTVMDSYKLNLTSFVCQEDVSINIPEFLEYLNERKKWDKENAGIDYYLNTFKVSENISLNMTEITIKLDEYFREKNEDWPQGGECGCCANYSGPCIRWSQICLAHDMACQRCQYSWCFPGCKPTSCRNNTISWYWFLVFA